MKWRLFRMAFKHPTWYDSYNTQHGVPTTQVTPCLEQPKRFEHSKRNWFFFFYVSDDEVFYFEFK